MDNLKIIYRKPTDLVKAKYNSRKISTKEMDDLIVSLTKFGFVEPIIINSNPDRKDIIVGGHQRVDAAVIMKLEGIPTVERNLTLPQEKELNIRLNKAGGKFDYAKLLIEFDKIDLIDFGFLDSEFPVIEEPIIPLEAAEEPVYPIVPKFSEKYDYILIMATNEIDIAFLDNFFDIQTEKSYKNSKVGVGHVVSFENFRKKVSDVRVG